MPRQQGLLLRGNRWHSNFKVPRDLQTALGKTHVRESLGTSDYREACRKVAYERARMTAFFESERRKIATVMRPRSKPEKNVLTAISKPDAFAMAVRYLVAREHVCEEWMEEKGRNLEQHERDEMASNVSADADALVTGYEYRGVPLDGTDELQTFLKQENIECAATSPAFKALRPLIRDATIEHLRREEERLTGRQVWEKNRLFKDFNSYSPTAAEAPKAPTLNDLLALRERFICKAGFSSKTADAARTTARVLRDYFGGGKQVSTIKREDMHALFDLLQRLPSNATKRYPGLTLAQAVEVADKEQDTRRLSRKTLHHHYIQMTTLFRLAIEEKLIAESPVNSRLLRMSVAEDVTAPPKEQFTIAELNRLFRSPLHAKCATDTAARRGCFWVPLLALFHGFRCNEVCQIFTEDVKIWEGITYIAVREEREDGSKCVKKLKTKQSKRDVPLHPELKQLGFLEFVEARRRDASSPRLFPELTPGHKGYFSDAFSKRFVHIVKNALGDGCGATMHSFRHMFRVATRAARIPSETVALLAGWVHGESSASRQLSHYGRGLENLPTLAEDIAKVEYRELDLSHLYTPETAEPKSPTVRLRE
ncbi:MAG: site-specific integrase [Chthoniobacter sp.]|uniref:site-specific integrase n=1 Tax=Chthoniobacter sp. TaxID=2510640 RepID=UPI0032A869C1